jgi:hypothetical protein
MAAAHVVPGVQYTLRDLWLHEDVQHNVTVDGSFAAIVAGNGSSAVFTLRPS